MKSSPKTLQARPGLPGTAAPDNSSHDHPNIMQPPKPLRRILTGLALALAGLGFLAPSSAFANGTAAYFETTFGSYDYSGASGTYASTALNWYTSGAGALAAFPSAHQITFGDPAGLADGSTLTFNWTSTNFGGLQINSTNANITLSGGNIQTLNGTTWTVAAGSTLNENFSYAGGWNQSSQSFTMAGGGTINFLTAIGFNSSGSTTSTQNMPGGTVNMLVAGVLSSNQASYILQNGTLNFATAAAAGAFRGLGHDGTTGFVTINGGTIDNTSGSGMTLDLKGNGTGQGSFKIGGDFTFTGSSDLSLGAAPVVLTASSQITVTDKKLTVGGIISGSTYGITKAGDGTLALTNANSYTGATTVNAGTLKLTGGSLANTAISVTGTGTLAVQPGSATPLSAGTTGAGSAGATLDLGSRTFDMTDGAVSTFNLQQQDDFAGAALTITDGATLKFNLGNSTSDKLTVTKAAAVSGTINVTVDTTGATSLAPATYPLVTAASGLTTSSPVWQFTGGGTTQTVTVGGTDYNLTLSATDSAVNLAVASTSSTPPTKLAITNVNDNINPTAGLGFSVTVVAQDDTNAAQVVTSNTEVTLTLKAGTGTGSLGGTVHGTIFAGASLVTITGVTYTKAESNVQLTASCGSLAAGDSVPFTVNAGAAATVSSTSGDSQSATVGTALALPFVVTVTDSTGNPISGTSVTFAVASVPGGATGQSLSTITITTDSNGQAASTLSLGNLDGTYTVTATSGSLSGSPLTFTATATPAGAPDAFNSTVAASPGTVTANGTSTSTITVTLLDASLNPVPGKTVELVRDGNTGPGTPTITTVSSTTSVLGVATFHVACGTLGAYDFKATDTTDGVTVSPKATVTFTSMVFGAEQYQANGANPSPIGVVSGDLLETSVASVTGEPASIDGGSPLPHLRNGIWGDYVAPSGSGYTTTYALDITTNPAGYDIKEIRLFSNGGSRTTQAYDIKYSLVGAPSTFMTLGTYTGTLPPSADGTLMTRTYDLSAGSVADSGAPLLTGVAAIQFVIRANGNGTLYREWDVTGSATGGASSPYASWAGSNAFDSLNSEGVAYGMAWLLGATSNSSPSIGLLPTVTGVSGGFLTVHFTRVLDLGSAKLYLEYSDSLAGWTPVEVPVTTGTDPVSGVVFTVATVGGLYDITAQVPPGSTGKRFARLAATE